MKLKANSFGLLISLFNGVLCATMARGQYSIHIIQPSPEWPNAQIHAKAISHDGRLIVGLMTTSTVGPSFRCLDNGVASPIAGWYSAATACETSATHGETVVGTNPFSRLNRNGAQTLFGGLGFPVSVSADGESISGFQEFYNQYVWRRAWRYHHGSLNYLELPIGSRGTAALDASLDGTVIVGVDQNETRRGFHWSESTGMTEILGFPLTHGIRDCRVTAISGDGNIVVGTSNFNEYIGAGFRWTISGGIERVYGLGTEQNLNLYDTNFDGSIVVGEFQRYNYIHEPYAWTSTIHGFTLRDLLEQHGVTLDHIDNWNSLIGWSQARKIAGNGSRILVNENVVVDISAGLPQRCVEGVLELEHRNLDRDTQREKYYSYEVRDADRHEILYGARMRIALDGYFKLLRIPPNVTSIELSIKPTHWLRRTRRIDLTGAITSIPVLRAENGDVDNDNEVNLVDFGLLAYAFGSVPTSPNWNFDADLDEDSEVNLIDYSILAESFGLQGDE